MSPRLAAGLTTAVALALSAAASAQPMPDQQRDRAVMHQDVGAMHQDSAELADLDAQIHRLAIRIRHERGDEQRADVGREHELQARAARIRAQSRGLGHEDHAVMRDYQQDRATPH